MFAELQQDSLKGRIFVEFVLHTLQYITLPLTAYSTVEWLQDFSKFPLSVMYTEAKGNCLNGPVLDYVLYPWGCRTTVTVTI